MTLFALVDCNNFYVSCERVFEPGLRGHPVVVLSNNDGCAVSRSQEAKDLGIKMGAPWFEIAHFAKSHGLIGRSSNYALYGSLSARVMSILREMAPRQEVYSIDESFLDMTGIAEPELLARDMRARVLRWTHIPVCVGIGSTKTRSKLANHVAKKTLRLKGVFNLERLTPQQQSSLLGKIEVGAVWGVGRRITAQLAQLGITTARDLRDADAEMIRERFSVVLARTVAELQGVSCLELEEVTPQKKQIMCSRSFGELVTRFSDLREAIVNHATRAGEKLRQEGAATTGVHVFIRSNPFREGDVQYKGSRYIPLATPTQDTRRIAAAALAGLEDMFVPGINYKKAGVMLCDLADHAVEQQDLFTPGDTENSQKLMSAVDALNRRHGRGTVFFAGSGIQKRWEMKSDMRSPGFTTRWDELQIVR